MERIQIRTHDAITVENVYKSNYWDEFGIWIKIKIKGVLSTYG